MRYEGIIFDLFGTLIGGYVDDPYRTMLAEMAHAVQAGGEEFARAWKRHYDQRLVGHHATTTQAVEVACRDLELTPSMDAIRRAVDIRIAFGRQMFVPFPETLPTLHALRKQGVRIGLMSDCTAEIPFLWNEFALADCFDVTLFSCEVGLRKPDPKFYAMALEQLAIPAGRCVYVGDGASGELCGALQAGLAAAVLIVAPSERQNVLTRPEAKHWAGPQIEHLDELPGLLDRMGSG